MKKIFNHVLNLIITGIPSIPPNKGLLSCPLILVLNLIITGIPSIQLEEELILKLL